MSSSKAASSARLIIPENQDIRTNMYQEMLPKLPIPSLSDTCSRYLETLETLQTPEEHAATTAIVKEFLENEGPVLQDKLQKYAEDKCSYIENFWNDAYLKIDGSVVLNLNPFFVLEDDPTPSRNNQIARAASLVISSLKFIKALRTETLEPDVWRSTPLCMHQYNYLFGCTRVPHVDTCGDEVVTDKSSRHIVVMCRAQFYYFDVIWSDGTIAITEKELCQCLREIQADAEVASPEQVAKEAVGVLTTDNRKTWAKLREELIKENAESVAIVDSALFLLCLDPTSPSTPAEAASTALHGTYQISEGLQTGTCINRWYDKLQIIVCDNGVAGVNFEHSTVDGHSVLRFVSDIYTDTIIRFAQTIRGGTVSLFDSKYKSPLHSAEPKNKKPDISCRKLEWVMSPELLRGIRYAESKISDLIQQNEVQVLEFTQYGKNLITKYNLSPDAFVQMAFVASYYALYGCNANTYEPVLTKGFMHGRTEAARSMTKDAANFARVFCSQDASELEKVRALRIAVKTQTALVKRSASGQGIDRHLYAIKCLWEQEAGNTDDAAHPKVFRDAGWKALNETILSTSNCGNPSLRLFGFGPVVSSGFGIGYIIKDEGIQFCASSKHRQTLRFLDTLQTYLLEIQALLMREEETMFPNLVKKRLGSCKVHRSISDMSISSSTGGYGFFDAGKASPATEEFKKAGRKI